MYKNFKPIEMSSDMLKKEVEIAKLRSAFSKYGLSNELNVEKILRYVKNNNEDIIDIFKLYYRMLNINTKKDVTKYKEYLKVFSYFDRNMDYLEDDACLQGVYVERFLEDFMDVPFNIEYNYNFKIKDMLESFHPAMCDDIIWDYVKDKEWDECNSIFDKSVIADRMHESYVEANFETVNEGLINKFDEECNGDFKLYHSNYAYKKIERLEEEYMIEKGVILYYSDNIDEFMKAHKNYEKALNLLTKKFANLSEVLLCECLRMSEIRLVDKSSNFIPEYIKNEYIFMSAFFTVGSKFKRSQEREENKSVSVSNARFFCWLIDTVEEVIDVLENKILEC